MHVEHSAAYIIFLYVICSSDIIGLQTAMTNLADGDKRLWVHLISVYVISWYIYKVSTSAHAYSPC